MALVCCLCLHRGTDEDRVTIQSEYVGGIGETQASLCVDRTRCWERWNKAHEVKQGDEGVKIQRAMGAHTGTAKRKIIALRQELEELPVTETK